MIELNHEVLGVDWLQISMWGIVLLGRLQAVVVAGVGFWLGLFQMEMVSMMIRVSNLRVPGK
jgi:hypothetical protein